VSLKGIEARVHFNIEDVVITNSTGLNGGSVYVGSRNNYLTFNNIDIVSTTATQYGGAFYIARESRGLNFRNVNITHSRGK